ncbi:MAG: hypothetical protein HY565_06165, partial [Candidatus Kerfeldbacteria bacterium]|nr:hypothetical protein [Candidatus Kerfeldbacteria bacterium]
FIVITMLSLTIAYYYTIDTPVVPTTISDTVVNQPITQPVNTDQNQTNTTSNDSFTAPTGAGDHAGTEGPWARRILGAYSDDGLTWTKTGEVITDQADVPSLAVDASGVLYMYYYGWTVGSKQNVPAVAVSTDDGATWSFHYLSFTGFPSRGDVSDPDVIFDAGIFRMYGTTRDGGNAHILYGTGTEYNDFTYQGVAFEPTGADAGVASVYQTTTGWHLLSLASLGVGGNAPAGQHWYATSKDGATFTQQSTVFFNVDQTQYFNGNVITVEGGYRMYLFGEGANGIRSWFSTDGSNWTLEAGQRLALEPDNGLEQGYVGDPDVIQLPSGQYFMAYATLIPN